jgi:hypothetical protein
MRHHDDGEVILQSVVGQQSVRFIENNNAHSADQEEEKNK